MDIAGKLTGVIVFVVGIVLLGVVFKYTVSTIGDAESAVRQGHLVMDPLFGGPDVAAPPVRRDRPTQPPRSSGSGVSGESAPTESSADPVESEEELSPLVRFGMIVGARIVGLCALGFLAGVIATQGARMCGAFAPPSRREQ